MRVTGDVRNDQEALELVGGPRFGLRRHCACRSVDAIERANTDQLCRIPGNGPAQERDDNDCMTRALDKAERTIKKRK